MKSPSRTIHHVQKVAFRSDLTAEDRIARVRRLVADYDQSVIDALAADLIGRSTSNLIEELGLRVRFKIIWHDFMMLRAVA